MQLGPVLAGSVKDWTSLIFRKVISHQKPSWQPFKPSRLHAVLFFSLVLMAGGVSVTHLFFLAIYLAVSENK